MWVQFRWWTVHHDSTYNTTAWQHESQTVITSTTTTYNYSVYQSNNWLLLMVVVWLMVCNAVNCGIVVMCRWTWSFIVSVTHTALNSTNSTQLNWHTQLVTPRSLTSHLTHSTQSTAPLLTTRLSTTHKHTELSKVRKWLNSQHLPTVTKHFCTKFGTQMDKQLSSETHNWSKIRFWKSKMADGFNLEFRFWAIICASIKIFDIGPVMDNQQPIMTYGSIMRFSTIQHARHLEPHHVATTTLLRIDILHRIWYLDGKLCPTTACLN